MLSNREWLLLIGYVIAVIGLSILAGVWLVTGIPRWPLGSNAAWLTVGVVLGLICVGGMIRK